MVKIVNRKAPKLPGFKSLDFTYHLGMLSSLLKSPWQELRRVFKTEDSRFIAIVGLKISAISFGITLVIYTFLFEVVRLNHAFFQAHGFDGMDESLFYEFVTQEALENFTLVFAFHIFLFFIGSYAGWLILRPFRELGEYSEKVIDNINTIYRVEQFSTYNLLTRFSELFFEFLREARKQNELLPHSVPPQFSKIHKPVFDKLFMFHFGLLLVIIAICSSLFIIENSSSVFMSMVELATKTLSDDRAVSQYFAKQMFILDDIVWLTVTLIILCYVLLGFHLYAKVSGAAFGIFATMRSFMKGNHSSRVHLLGFAYVRDYTRKLNKYLDYIEKNFSKNKAKNSNL